MGGPVAVVQSDSHPATHGQSRGMCRSSRRLVEAIRAGMLMIFLRRLAHRARWWPAATAVARARLNAVTPSATQAAFAVYFPEGRWASALSLSSAMTCSTAHPTVGTCCCSAPCGRHVVVQPDHVDPANGYRGSGRGAGGRRFRIRDAGVACSSRGTAAPHCGDGEPDPAAGRDRHQCVHRSRHAGNDEGHRDPHGRMGEGQAEVSGIPEG